MAKRQRQRRRERRRKHSERRNRYSLITGASVTAGALLGIASPALADSFYVSRGGDMGDGTCDATCTLRDAVDDANANSNFSNIFFESNLSGAIITLTAGDLPILYPAGVYGPGPDQLTISGNDADRIFTVNPPLYENVSIYSLTLTDGAAVKGGAIYNSHADLTILDTVISGNFATEDGGAIYDYGGGHIAQTVVSRSTLNGNTAGHAGGAIYGAESFGRVSESTLSGNTAVAGNGGAIASEAFSPRGYVEDSTISGNSADDDGGGVSADYVSVYNTILANNTASAYGDVDSNDFYAATSLIEDPGGTTVTGVSNLTGIDPQLGPLGITGGHLPTLKPGPSSPVVDQGFSSDNRDQRDFSRPVDNPNVANVANGDGNDIGSVELTLEEGPQPPPPPPGTSIPGTSAPGPTFNLQAAIKRCKKKFPKGPKRARCIKKAKRRVGS